MDGHLNDQMQACDGAALFIVHAWTKSQRFRQLLREIEADGHECFNISDDSLFDMKIVDVRQFIREFVGRDMCRFHGDGWLGLFVQ